MRQFSSTVRPTGRVGMLRRAASVLVVAGLIVGLAACSDDPLAQQAKAGDNKGYVAGDFSTKEFTPDERGEAISFQGTTDSGATASSADYAGKVLVVNFWYSQCAPCRVEAPRLEKAYQEFAGKDVAFLGINIYDQAESSLSFSKNYGVTYPSLIAIDDSKVKLAFASAAPLTAVPVTLVLDKQGRVMARIVGELPDASILTALVRDGLAEAS